MGAFTNGKDLQWMHGDALGIEFKHWISAKPLKEASKVVGLDEKRLEELADDKVVPHLRIDGGPPRFHMPTLKAWIEVNLVVKCPGELLLETPVEITNIHVSLPSADTAQVPESLRSVIGLRVADFTTQCSGIYFLCKDDDCVYIGQANRVARRIPAHLDEKDFDRAYYIPVAIRALSQIEDQLNEAVVPKYGKCPACQRGRARIAAEHASAAA
jgi:hypothetical protein